MGRTVASFTQVIYREEKEWRQFRRALRKEDRERFDRLFGYARIHAAECSYSGRLVPFDAMLMCMLLEQEKRIDELEQRVNELGGDGKKE
jgi:hypothetical protein